MRIPGVLIGLCLQVFSASGVSADAQDTGGTDSIPGVLLADDSCVPAVEVGWTAIGEGQTRRADRSLGAPDDAEALPDCNLSCSVSLGGTRLETGAGHPRGAILRVELRKRDPNRALFKGVDAGSSVHLAVSGVRFNQRVRVEPETALVHLRYSLTDVQACSLPPSATSQFLLADPHDSLGGMVTPGENATPGGLSGAPGMGSVEASVAPDGSVSFAVDVPYALLRHLKDPWASGLPGTFFEPIRLHAEIEVLPVDAEPIDRTGVPERAVPTPDD